MTTMPFVLTKARGWLTAQFRNDAIIILVLFALVIVSWLPRLSGPIDLRWDGGVYYILGTSLAEGKGYRLLNEPGDIEAIQYPPLLPLIVAAHQWVLGTNDPSIVGHWLRLSFFLVFNVYIFIIYLMLRNYLPLKYAFLATLVCLFNFYTYFLSDLCIPDILFGLTTTLFLICYKKRSVRAYSILTVLLAIASYALRTIGIALFAAWAMESLFNREFKKAAVRLALALIPILCWQSYISSVESGQLYKNPDYEYQRKDYLFYNVSYAKNIFSLKDPSHPELGGATFVDIANRSLHNMKEIPTTLGEAVSSKKVYLEMASESFNKRLAFPIVDPPVINFVLIMLGCLVLCGLVLQLARAQWIIPLYILIYLAAICLTPWPIHFRRYVAPLAPILALSLFKVLLTIKDQSYQILPGKWKVAGLAFAVSLLSLIFISESVTLFFVYKKWHQKVVYEEQNGKAIVYRLFFYYDAYRALDEGLDWLKRQAKPDDVVAASMPHWVYLRTGLKAVMPPLETNPVKTQELLDSVPVNYIILEEVTVNTRKYALPMIQSYPDHWKRVYSDSFISESGEKLKDRFEIYQRVGPGRSDAEKNSKNYSKQ